MNLTLIRYVNTLLLYVLLYVCKYYSNYRYCILHNYTLQTETLSTAVSNLITALAMVSQIYKKLGTNLSISYVRSVNVFA